MHESQVKPALYIRTNGQSYIRVDHRIPIYCLAMIIGTRSWSPFLLFVFVVSEDYRDSLPLACTISHADLLSTQVLPY